MTKTHFSLISLAIASLLILSSNVQLLAQGRTIPRGETAKSQEEVVPEELPEGQKYRYKRFNGLNVSVDIFDPVLHLFYIDHCSYEAQVMADFHHRFFPMATFGMGIADEKSNNGLDYGTSEKQECRFKSNLAPFAKLGLAYNFQYNSVHPDDYYMAFFRYAVAHNKADITNLYYADDTWGDKGPYDITGQSYTTHWLEAGFLIKVKICSHVSAGWDLYWKLKLAQTGTTYGAPYYVPGMGTTQTKVGFSFRIYYDIF